MLALIMTILCNKVNTWNRMLQVRHYRSCSPLVKQIPSHHIAVMLNKMEFDRKGQNMFKLISKFTNIWKVTLDNLVQVEEQ